MLKENKLLLQASKRRKAIMMRQKKNGLTDKAIADEHGISRARVQQILKPKREVIGV